VGGFQEVESLMDVAGLAALFRSLHDEVDTFVRRESDVLFEQEKRNQQARQSFKDSAGLVRGFLEEFAPEGGLPDLDNEEAPDASGDSEEDEEGSDAEDKEAARRQSSRRQAAGKDKAPEGELSEQ
ncbi:unnamed protein product, partial [Polarella glacialis]